MSNNLISNGAKDICETLSEHKIAAGMLLVTIIAIAGAAIDKNYSVHCGDVDLTPNSNNEG